MAKKIASLDLDQMLARFAKVPTQSLASAASEELVERIARDNLKDRGIRLRGDKTAIKELVRYEIRSDQRRLERVDQDIDTVLRIPVEGRPNSHSSLRDLLIFSHNHLMQWAMRADVNTRGLRLARKATAQVFALTCDTRNARTRRPSCDQVKWASERTFARFARLWPYDQTGTLFGDAIGRSISVISGYIEEQKGLLFNLQTFEADIASLTLLCRTLDAAQQLDRLKTSSLAKSGTKKRTAVQRELH